LRPTGRAGALGPSSRRTGLVIAEIMYHPASARMAEDGVCRAVHSNPFSRPQRYRIRGRGLYLPTGHAPASGASCRARSPADIQAVYGIATSPVLYQQLSNKSGTVRLRNRACRLLEMNTTAAAWPVAADGGHSLVLTRASYGEATSEPGGEWSNRRFAGLDGWPVGDPRATWSSTSFWRTLICRAGFRRALHHSAAEVNLSGYWLTDDPTTNKFRIPDGTFIGRRALSSSPKLT